MSSEAIVLLVVLLVGVALTALMFGFSYLTAPKPTPPRVPTKAELEKDARKHWDEQVRALGGVEDELFFYPPSNCLYANRIVTNYLDGGCITYNLSDGTFRGLL